MNITIGEKIKFLRMTKGMTQEKLAERLGISAQAVSKWERSITYPDIVYLPALTKALDTSADALLGIERNRKNKKSALFDEAYDLWQKGSRNEEMYWLAREAVASDPQHFGYAYWLASVEFGLAFEENLKPDPDGIYFETLVENALRRYDHIIENCPDAALRSVGILGKITVLRFTERIDEADWSAECEYPDSDIHTAEEALRLCADGRRLLAYLQTENCSNL
ncbi:MAG: helix-turn-helix domain-containing protein [Ruminococcaceae bacterium]|nr:helix-turn-helix domain-containing protein [Oscillospiraceae bacterium]